MNELICGLCEHCKFGQFEFDYDGVIKISEEYYCDLSDEFVDYRKPACFFFTERS